jgi:hypothetical protein
MYPDLLDYVNATLRFNKDSNSFLVQFCNASLAADAQNFEHLRPVLEVMRAKYPAPAELLESERRTRP